MAEKSVMDKMQTALGITRAELLAVIVLAGGLLAGVIIKYIVAGNEPVYYAGSPEITELLDSLAEAEVPLYTGTNDTAAIEAASARRPADTAAAKYSQTNMPAQKININKATEKELMRLPGIGPKTAADIVARRKEKSFSKPEDIMDVKGIGPKKFEKVKSFIVVK